MICIPIACEKIVCNVCKGFVAELSLVYYFRDICI